MNLEDYVNEQIRRAPEANIKTWLDEESENQNRVGKDAFFDEKDRLIAIQAMKCILYLKYDFERCSKTDAFMKYHDQAAENGKYGFAYYFKLNSIFNKTQLMGLKAVMDILEETIKKDLPEGLQLKAEIDTYGNPIIKDLL